MQEVAMETVRFFSSIILLELQSFQSTVIARTSYRHLHTFMVGSGELKPMLRLLLRAAPAEDPRAMS
jgi:hypothetical protein